MSQASISQTRSNPTTRGAKTKGNFCESTCLTGATYLTVQIKTLGRKYTVNTRIVITSGEEVCGKEGRADQPPSHVYSLKNGLFLPYTLALALIECSTPTTIKLEADLVELLFHSSAAIVRNFSV